MSVADAVFFNCVFTGRLSLVDLSLRSSDGRVHFVSNFIDSLAPVELVLDNFVGLEESLQFGRQLVVLLRQQVHVLGQSVDLALLAVRLIDLLRVLVFEQG